MSFAALSPAAPEPPSPMVTSVTPTLDPDTFTRPAAASLEHRDGSSSPGPGPSQDAFPGGGAHLGRDPAHRSIKPPPLHAGADWKVVLHLPEIQTWLRATGERVTQLTHSAGQDGDNRHVDVHLVQLKDICEDISDHVEQIHALLETEFSLKLLSYSVNIIVDIRTVQLLWHQLRVSVLVLKERLLQGLQDSNGNYTRQTDILQAFSQDQHQTRLDALTEVDARGQLTIRCSRDYFSLDCGITAFELSDYSPGDEAEAPPSEDEEAEVVRPSSCSSQRAGNLNLSPSPVPMMQCGAPGPSESAERRPSPAGALPTQPSQPKRAAVFSGAGDTSPAWTGGRPAFWLELDSVYPESLVDAAPPAEAPRQTERTRGEERALGAGGSDSSLPSPMRERFLSSDPEASGEESDAPPPPSKAAVWIVRHQVQKAAPASSSTSSLDREPWSGSEEFLALPPQLHRTEQLALKLESLAQSAPPRPGDCDSTQDALQDVDDWDLTDWDDVPSLLPPLLPYRRNLVSRFSSASSSDFALSLDESIESGPLSDLQSEDEEGRGSAHRRPGPPAAPGDGRGAACIVQRLLEDIQSHDNDPNIWRKIEGFVQQLDGFISWLQEALESTDNWTQPRQDLDSLRAYLDTHLSFKLSVEGRGALKESLMEEGRALLAIITSHQSGLKEILHMVSSQWDQLQRQIRRQHGWMLRALRCIQARLLCAGQSQEPLAAPGDAPANQQASCPPDGPEPELIPGQCEALAEQMAAIGLHDTPSASRGLCSQLGRNDSLQEFEAEYQELWDWLMDMDAMVTDSHQLMMSEEQRHHLFKSSHAELVAMETRRTGLLGRAESLKRSGAQLPANFHRNAHNLTHTWRQLENLLSQHSAPGSSSCSASFHQSEPASAGQQEEAPRSALSPLTNSLLEQLEARIKELKAWLRDTELLIFNSCLGRDKEASEQLASFKSLCCEVRARRRGVASVLKLCQKLLQQSQSGPMAEVGPEAEQHREALQLLSINLERRWEAIVMQALQWQNRLRRQLGETQVPGGALEPGLVDLRQITPVPVGPADDSWEWDETDMAAAQPNASVRSTTSSSQEEARPDATPPPRGGRNVYQVYSLHTVELYSQPRLPRRASSTGPESGARKQQQLLLKSASKDSSFSSMESLPDLLGGATPSIGRGGVTGQPEGGSESGRGSGQSAGGRRSESESGIVSDTGSKEEEEEEEEEEEQSKLETVGGTCVVPHAATEHNHRRKKQENMKEKGKRRDESRRNREEEKRRRNRREGGEAVEVLINGQGILTPADCEVGDTPASKASTPRSDSEEVRADPFTGLPTPPALRCQATSPVFSQGSSLESLLALGLELFPPKEPLHRSASLESCLIPGRGAAETSDGPASLGDPEGGAPGEEGEPSSGELSRRTLDLLKRLEDIQSPLGEKMTRSVSDMTLRSGSLPRCGIASSPSLGGRRLPLSGVLGSSRRGPPSLVNESSATASLTELSSTEDSSLGSEDFATLRSQRRRLQLLLPDPAPSPNANAGSCGRRCHRNAQGAHGTEEADAASLSLLVNVSCSSACTDEDDSDLLSSSTLTLTEEELGVRDGEEEHGQRLSSASSGDEEEEMEGSYVLGLEYMKRELQSWIRFPRASSSSSSSSKTEAVLRDELQCGTYPPSAFTSSSRRFPNRAKSTETNGQSQREQEEEEEENCRNAARSLISHYVDDVENGNVEQSGSPAKDEDDELLREEASVFAKRGGAPRGSYVFMAAESAQESSSTSKMLPFFSKCASSLVGQLRGELACHSSSLPSPPSLSPLEDCRSHDAFRGGGRKAITSQEKFKFSSFVKEETRSQVRDRKSSLPPKKRHSSHPSCCGRLPSPSSPSSPLPCSGEPKENVHDFVMEIIDMTSLALKSKESPPEEPDRAPLPPLSHIRDKVLQHSHRPLHLRKGDFYSYLSLSSHDSDCGEVSRCSEDGSSSPAPYGGPSPEPQGVPAASPPPSPDIRDEETLFTACTEEVYLGPPLCYSMALPKKSPGLPLRPAPPSPTAPAYEPGTGPAPPSPSGDFLFPASGLSSSSSSSSPFLQPRCSSPSAPLRWPGSVPPSLPTAPPPSRGEDLRLLCDVAGGAGGAPREERSRNEGPPYLNPRARVPPPMDSSTAACLADAKTPRSNMGAVMTEISVCGSATNPSKEPAAATRSNPQMNCSAMREADRGGGGPGEEGRIPGERSGKRGLRHRSSLPPAGGQKLQ